MDFVPMTDLETPRLILRKIRMTDLHNYHTHLTSDPAVARFMLWQAQDSPEHTQATIARIQAGYAAGTRYHWGIALKETDTLIGTIALLGFEEATDSCSFAYMLGKNFWGRGYGTEALHSVFQFAFREMGISRIQADHFAENSASGAVMEKVGMRKTGILPGKYEKNGTSHDAVAYCITREQWSAD